MVPVDGRSAALVEVAVGVPLLGEIAVEFATVVDGPFPVGTRPLDLGIGDKRDRGAVTLQVLEVDVEDDNAFAGVASASPIPVGVVTADRLRQSQCGPEVIDCSGLSVEATEDRRLLAFFRGKSVVVARYGFGALLPSETAAVVVRDSGVYVLFGFDSVQHHLLATGCWPLPLPWRRPPERLPCPARRRQCTGRG